MSRKGNSGVNVAVVSVSRERQDWKLMSIALSQRTESLFLGVDPRDEVEGVSSDTRAIQKDKRYV